jgi:hypothetical protein
LDAQQQPISMMEIKKDALKHQIEWDDRYYSHMHEIYKQPLTFVYGLYSRHGKFYPPFNFVPDINWPEFVGNVY